MAYKRVSPAPVVEGGTGAQTLTAHGVLVGEGTSAVTPLSVGSNGQLLCGSSGADPAFTTLTSTANTIIYTPGAHTLNLSVSSGLRITTGWESWGGAGNYFDDTTLGTFTLLRPGTGYINSGAVSWTAPQSIVGMVAGTTTYIYIDNTGTIGSTATRTDALYKDNIVLFECLRDSTPVTNNQITVKDNHDFRFPVESSNYLHDVVGTVIENNNNGADIILNGTQKIQINGADVLNDHGLETTIPDSGGVGVTWRKMYTDGAGKWATYNVNDTFLGFWNNAGTPTALTAGRFGVYTLYVCKDTLTTTTPTYFAVLDIAQYGSQAAASTAIANGTTAKATNELNQLEIAQLGYIIYRQSTAAITIVTISKAILKQTLSTSGTNTAALINTVVTNFNNVLSSADTNVQAALDTLDDFGSGAGNQTVSLLTGAGIKVVTLGSNNTSSSTTIDCGTAGASFGATANQHTTIIGSTNAASATTVQSGSGVLNVTATGGALTVNSGVGALGISTDASATTISIGTGGAIKALTIGSTNTSSSTAIKSGSGNVAINAGLTIDSTGRNYNTVQPCFLAYLPSNVLNVTGAGNPWQMGSGTALTKVFDIGTNLNTNGTFTAPITGKYFFNASATFLNTTAPILSTAQFNASNRILNCATRGQGATTNYPIYGSCFIDMDAADTLTINLVVDGDVGNTATAQGNSSNTYMSGYLVF